MQNSWLLSKRCCWRLEVLVLQLHFASAIEALLQGASLHVASCAKALLESARLQTLSRQPQVHGGGELHRHWGCLWLFTQVFYLFSASVTQKLLCRPASHRTIPLVMGEMQLRVSVEPTPRKGMWWNTFPGMIFNSQVCRLQLPLWQPRCNLSLKAARDALEDISSKLSHILLLCVNARLMLD